MTQAQWIKTTIKEPFPVFYSHVEHKSERRPETAKGPFSVANGSFYHVNTGRNLAWRQAAADHLRKDGWTVTVEITDA